MLWAVHIPDYLLSTPWWLGGYALAGLLLAIGCRRLHDDEIPRIALLTAAFFVASLIHVPLPPTSVHLLLNGLVGVLLGWRAFIAIPVGLFLQALFFQHGGFTTIGVNSCVMGVPALVAYYLFHGLLSVRWCRRPWFRSLLVAASCLVWTQSVIYSVTLLCTNSIGMFDLNVDDANAMLCQPWTWAVSGMLAVALTIVERRLETAPEFPLGLLVGEVSVLATVALHSFVLMAGGITYWQTPAIISMIAHLPIAVVEGVVLGFVVGFLSKVKPSMLSPRHPTG
jgi:ABC-type Co2+ transport system permease subunit